MEARKMVDRSRWLVDEAIVGLILGAGGAPLLIFG